MAFLNVFPIFVLCMQLGKLNCFRHQPTLIFFKSCKIVHLGACGLWIKEQDCSPPPEMLLLWDVHLNYISVCNLLYSVFGLGLQTFNKTVCLSFLKLFFAIILLTSNNYVRFLHNIQNIIYVLNYMLNFHWTAILEQRSRWHSINTFRRNTGTLQWGAYIT